MLATTAARPYAKAIFELAAKQETNDAWLAFLRKLAAVCGHADARSTLANPLLSTEQQCQWLKKACKDVLFAEGERLLWLLAARRRLMVVPEIFELYQQLQAAKAQQLRAQCVTFMPLSKDDKDVLTQGLKRYFDKEVSIDEVIEDKSLLGGVMIRIGDRVIDGSLKGKLNRLRQQLMASKGN